MTGPLLASAVLLAGLAVVAGPGWPRLWLALTLAAAVAALGAAVASCQTTAGWEWQSGFLLGGERVHLRLDGLSALFVVLAAVVGGAGAVYSRGYWSDLHAPDSAPRGRAWWSAFMLSMLLVLTVSNGIHFLMAWETFAVCGYFLITLDGKKTAVRKAGWLYLAASHAGTVCLFAFFALLAVRTGGWDLAPMRERAALAPLFWLALAGFGMKAGFFRCIPGCPRPTPTPPAMFPRSCREWPSRWAFTAFCASAGGWRYRPPQAGWSSRWARPARC